MDEFYSFIIKLNNDFTKFLIKENESNIEKGINIELTDIKYINNANIDAGDILIKNKKCIEEAKNINLRQEEEIFESRIGTIILVYIAISIWLYKY